MHHHHKLPTDAEQQPQTHLTQPSPFMEDILAPGQLNRQMHTPEEERPCLLENRVDLDNDDTALQSHLDFPAIVAGVNDWAFQGADGAFFDSLLRGCSALEK
jgi:hypothetical protein